MLASSHRGVMTALLAGPSYPASLAGLAAFLAGLLLAGFAPDMGLLVAGRALQGLRNHRRSSGIPGGTPRQRTVSVRRSDGHLKSLALALKKARPLQFTSGLQSRINAMESQRSNDFRGLLASYPGLGPCDGAFSSTRVAAGEGRSLESGTRVP